MRVAHRQHSALLAVALIASACGGAEERPPANEGDAVPLPLRAFHDVLDRLWRLSPGNERAYRTCEEIVSLQQRAAGVRADVAAGEGENDPVADAVVQLTNTVDALQVECQAMETHDQRATAEDVDTALSHVREAFDRLTEAVEAR